MKTKKIGRKNIYKIIREKKKKKTEGSRKNRGLSFVYLFSLTNNENSMCRTSYT
jgi:hypothetical protein